MVRGTAHDHPRLTFGTHHNHDSQPSATDYLLQPRPPPVTIHDPLPVSTTAHDHARSINPRPSQLRPTIIHDRGPRLIRRSWAFVIVTLPAFSLAPLTGGRGGEGGEGEWGAGSDSCGLEMGADGGGVGWGGEGNGEGHL